MLLWLWGHNKILGKTATMLMLILILLLLLLLAVFLLQNLRLRFGLQQSSSSLQVTRRCTIVCAGWVTAVLGDGLSRCLQMCALRCPAGSLACIGYTISMMHYLDPVAFGALDL